MPEVTGHRATLAALVAPAGALVAGMIALAALWRRWQDAALVENLVAAPVMVPATAIGVLLAAAALLLVRAGGGATRGAGRLAAVAVIVAALLMIGLNVAYWINAAGVSTLIAGKWWAQRPSPPTGLCLLFIGISLLALGGVHRRARRYTAAGAVAALAIAVAALIGHAYGASVLYGLERSSGMSIATAVAAGAIALGAIFSNPSRGFAARFLRDSPGGHLLRRLLLVAIIAPPLLGWIALRAEESGFVDFAFGTALLDVSLMILLIGLIVRQARVLDSINAQREQLLEAERAAHEQVINTLESITDAFFTVDREWRFTYVNREAERLLQRSRDALLGQNLWFEFPGAAGGVFQQEYQRAMDEQKTVQFETHYAPLGIWVEVRAYPAPNSLSVYFRDVTSRRLAEEKLRESERSFRGLANSIPQLAWMTDSSGWIFWYSDRWYEYTGTTLEEMEGWGWTKVHHPQYVDGVVKRIRHSFETGELWEDIFPLRSKSGEYHWFLSRAVPIKDDEGKITRWFGTNTDVTEQRRATEALRESEERFRAFAENASVGIFVIDEESIMHFVNPAVEQIFGYAQSELIGRSLDMLMPEDQRQLHNAGMKRYRETGQRKISWEGVELPGLTRNGRCIPLEISFGEFERGGQHYFTGIARDITWRKQAEEALRESEERYRYLVDMIPQHIWTTDPDGSHNYFSRRWYEYTGLKPEQTRGDGWLDLLHPEDKEQTIARWHHSIQTGEPYSIEYRFRRVDGNYRWFLGQALPLRNETGDIIQWFGTLTDISERKWLEQEREQLLSKEREARAEAERRREELERVTESRAELIRGFSHDVRNPLAAADMSALMLEIGSVELSEKQRESVQRIRRSIRTSLQLSDDLLEVARADTGQIEIEYVSTDIGEVAREVTDDILAQAASVGLSVEVRAPEGLLTETDPTRLRQILTNLLSNTVKYAPNGQVTVGAEVRASGGPRPGNWIAVSVSDTGPGIPEDKKETIFQEYTRLDPKAQQGAGIGLAISRRIARLIGGDLTVESEPGRGATFTLWLPRIGIY